MLKRFHYKKIALWIELYIGRVKKQITCGCETLPYERQNYAILAHLFYLSRHAFRIVVDCSFYRHPGQFCRVLTYKGNSALLRPRPRRVRPILYGTCASSFVILAGTTKCGDLLEQNSALSEK